MIILLKFCLFFFDWKEPFSSITNNVNNFSYIQRYWRSFFTNLINWSSFSAYSSIKNIYNTPTESNIQYWISRPNFTEGSTSMVKNLPIHLQEEGDLPPLRKLLTIHRTFSLSTFRLSSFFRTASFRFAIKITVSAESLSPIDNKRSLRRWVLFVTAQWNPSIDFFW